MKFCGMKTVEGFISLKRQYLIENTILQKYVDIDIKANDELLQVALEEKADDRLKNIVATIQGEQNSIIRADMNKALIVQGVAGSGKTTIALHRIAYLIYRCENKFDPDEFMIIAPNKFFLNYISNVLPDLGVENVKQYTFEDLAYEIIGKKLKTSDNNEKLVEIVNKDFDDINNGNISIMIRESQFKSSIKYKDYVDMYLEELEANFLPNEDFVLDCVKIYSREDLQKLFKENYKKLDFESRIREIKKHVFSKIKYNKEEIEKTITLKRKNKINNMLKEDITEEEKRKRRIEIFEETEGLLKRLEKDDIKIVDFYFNKIKRLDSTALYKDFIEYFIVNKLEDRVLEEYLRKNTLKNLNKKEVSFEDLAPIIYLHYKVYGLKNKKNMKHVIVDEAQDYGEFQFSVLKTILNSSSMTVLGDIAQGVHYYRGINDWKKFIDVEFPNESVSYLTLSKTYRTTKDIMNEANNVIDKLPDDDKKFILKGDPVIDRKNSLEFISKNNEDEIIEEINAKIDNYLNEGYKSIAIIGKDIDECNRIERKIKKYRSDVKLIKSKDSEYNAGISIVPSYLAKGLEFDVVALFNVSDEKYNEDLILDIKLLYVAITRAMSKLDAYYIGNISKLFDKDV